MEVQIGRKGGQNRERKTGNGSGAWTARAALGIAERTSISHTYRSARLACTNALGDVSVMTPACDRRPLRRTPFRTAVGASHVPLSTTAPQQPGPQTGHSSPRDASGNASNGVFQLIKVHIISLTAIGELLAVKRAFGLCNSSRMTTNHLRERLLLCAACEAKRTMEKPANLLYEILHTVRRLGRMPLNN